MQIFELRLFLAMLCLCASIGAVPAQEQDVWRVQYQWAKCVIQHAERYVENNSDDPVVIYVEACPEPSAEKSIAMLLENSIVPELKVDQGGTGVDPIVVFTRSELLCLSRIELNDTSDVVALPKKPRC